MEQLKITHLIGRAPWREAVTYRDTWPHEYVLSGKDGQRELFEVVCARLRAGEGVPGTFFGRANTYLFIGDYKYWLIALRPGRPRRRAAVRLEPGASLPRPA